VNRVETRRVQGVEGFLREARVYVDRGGVGLDLLFRQRTDGGPQLLVFLRQPEYIERRVT